MMNKIIELADRFDMLPAGALVLCAVSGGADSVCLLHVLGQLDRDLRIVCAHYNHHLRGEESDRDEAFVRELCARFAVPFVAAAAMSPVLPAKTASASRRRRGYCATPFWSGRRKRGAPCASRRRTPPTTTRRRFF